MDQMSHLDFNDTTVLDFGTGTGILAILAKKMGAVAVTGIDNDDWSIDNAKENVLNNKVDHIVIEKASTVPATATYDIILANINLNVIVQNMPLIARVCKPGTLIVLSGFLVDDETAVRTSLQDNQLVFKQLTQKSGWICVLASKT
jgi:ribosomal protein L11 methyltransferase